MNDAEQIIAMTGEKVSAYGPRDQRYRDNYSAYEGRYDRIVGLDMSADAAMGKDIRQRRDNSYQVWNLMQPIVNTTVIQLARLPEIIVPAIKMADQKEALFAEKQEKIAYAWWDRNQMMHKHGRIAFNLATYGSSVLFVRPDEKMNMPVIQIRPPGICYPEAKGEGEREFDWVSFRWMEDEATVRRRYPNLSFGTRPRPGNGKKVEVIEYIDEEDYVVIVENERVRHKKHDFGYVPVAVTPAVDIGEIFGPSDIDQLVAINIYLNALMTKLADALEENLYPMTFIEGGTPKLLNTGPGAINWLEDGSKPHRLDPARIPPELFHQVEYVEEFMRTAAIWPRVMSGQSDSSISTGKALNKLQSSSTGMASIRQQYMGADLQRVNEWGFRQFEALWPKERYKWSGATTINAASAPGRELGFTVDFIPSEDINERYDSFLYYSIFGADLQGATNSGLQLQGAGIISKRFFRNQLPGIRDAEGMREEIKEEKREEMEFEIELQQKLIDMQTQAAMQQQQGALGPPPEGGAPPMEGGAPPMEGGAGPPMEGGIGGAPGGPAMLPGGQPFAMGMGEPLSGEENFPLPFDDVKPYPQALESLTGGGEQAPQGLGKEDNKMDGAVTVDEVSQAIGQVQKLKGDVYLLGRIVERGEVTGAIEIGLTVMNDKQTIINALRDRGWKMSFIKVDPSNIPKASIPVAQTEMQEVA